MTEQSPAEAIFFAALEKGTPEERAAYLDAACGDDSELRRRVERLLEAHSQAGDFLESPAPTATYVPGGEQAGAVVAGRYKLLEQIGEGGMGAVWVADQFEPVRRRVALKVIKPGMDSRSVLARFEAERQALALMDHPNIARVLDAGTTADGRPFFVMELVKGTPITQFCDARKLTARERLELFVPVCQAVQHAHQKGIIHRDLKPSNVLVALHDERPVPKVIDFGVAKAVGQQLTEKTVYTGFGALVGTPAYMAPEQATFNALDVDTRADVYALGVLLYELLSGSPPFEPERLKSAALDEVLRLVREEEPPRPSHRLSTSQTRASIAAVRQTDPNHLTRLMRGELDWIVMKALEKDRNRRYDTATGLAADVQRYLAGETVQAHPPSTAYRLRKFMRKHRALLTTAAAFAGLLLAAAAVSSWLAVEARRAEKTANEQRKEANEQRKEAIDQYRSAERTEWFLWGVLERAEIDRQEAEHLANNLQVDADLAEHDDGIRLLRLCRTLKTLPERHVPGRTVVMPGRKIQDTDVPPMTFTLSDDDDPRRQELREFVTAAILAAGQDSATLLPPITHDGHEVLGCLFSPDHQTLLTYGKDATARLWDVRTARQIAVLRQGDEKVVNCGLSPDGRTVFTDDEASVARLWDVPNGKFRAATDPRPNRYERLKDYADDYLTRGFPEPSLPNLPPYPMAQVGKERLLTWKAIAQSQPYQHPQTHTDGPVELWDTATGRLIARLDIPAHTMIGEFQLQGGERWVTAIGYAAHKKTVDYDADAPPETIVFNEPVEILVFSATDGRFVRRLPFPDADRIWNVVASPTGRRIAAIVERHFRRTPDIIETHKKPPQLWVWDTTTWRADTATPGGSVYASSLKFWTEDLFLTAVLEGDALFIGDKHCNLFRYAHDGSLACIYDDTGSEPTPLSPDGKLLMVDQGVYDTRTRRILNPPEGLKLPPEVARFSPDGRYMAWGDGLLDMKIRKTVPVSESWGSSARSGYLPEFGHVSVLCGDYAWRYGTELRLLPGADHLNLPPDLLELWAQVAIRGELGPEGTFVKWDEPTWEKKRQELAAKPAPDPDVPFPGFVATDRLHWLRAEYSAAASEADRLCAATELLRRAEALGDQSETVRWRAVLAKLETEQAPPSHDAPP